MQNQQDRGCCCMLPGGKLSGMVNQRCTRACGQLGLVRAGQLDGGKGHSKLQLDQGHIVAEIQAKVEVWVDDDGLGCSHMDACIRTGH